MRPWFMLFVFVLIVSFILILLFVVNFVLTNREMFEATFNIVIAVPYVGWSHTWESVQFMYIIAGSILLGALVIAISTLILDTKRTLKVRNLRKELKRLQEALQHAPQYVVEKPDEEEQLPDVEEEPVDLTSTTTATPEEITKSFEDAVQQNDFLEESKKRREEELSKDGVDEMDTHPNVYEELRDQDQEPATEPEPTEEEHEEDEDTQQEAPIEAEVVESEEFSEKHEETTEHVEKRED